MKINNVLVANLNPTDYFMPYFKSEQGIFPSEFRDSPIQIFPAPAGYYGFTGIQTKIGEFLSPPSSPNDLPSYGMQLLNSNNYGRFVRLGDYGGNNSSSILTWNQPLGQKLSSFFLRDNFDNTLYLEVTPTNLKYSLGDFATNYIGMRFDGINGFGHFYLGDTIGLEISSINRTVLIGQGATGSLMGVNYQISKMYVGDALIEDNLLNQSSKFIRLITSSGQEYWIPLFQ